MRLGKHRLPRSPLPPRRLSPTPPSVERVPAWERAGAVMLWYVLPGFALLAAATYLALAVAWHVNPPVVPVLGTSMHPTLHAGDLVFIHGEDPATLKKGDVIAFRVPKALQDKYDVPGSYVHRIVGIERSKDGQIFFVTKGDNVQGPEPFKTAMQNVVGKMVYHVPKLGYPILFWRSKQGKIFMAAVALALLIYFLMGFYERRQEFAEANALTLAAIVDEARQLRDSMAGTPGAPRGPPAPEQPTEARDESSQAETAVEGPRMLPVEGEPPAGAFLCARGCHVLLPGARFDPHTGEAVDVPEPVEPAAEVSALAVVSEPGYVPVWERPHQPHLAEFELAPAYAEKPGEAEPATGPEPEPAGEAEPFPAPPAIDFERLEREIHEAVRSNADVQGTMRDLVGAVGEYGEHLRSHTAAVQNLAASTGDLRATTAEMRQFLASLTALLTTLVQQQQDRQQPPQA